MPFFIGRRLPRPEDQPPRRALASGWVSVQFYRAGTIDKGRYKARAAAEAAALRRWPDDQAVVIEARNRDQALAKLMGMHYSHWYHLTLRYFTLPINRVRRKLHLLRAPRRPGNFPPDAGADT